MSGKDNKIYDAVIFKGIKQMKTPRQMLEELIEDIRQTNILECDHLNKKDVCKLKHEIVDIEIQLQKIDRQQND